MKSSRNFSVRAVISLLLVFSFLGLAVSGVVIYFAPQCSVAEAMGWSVAGLSKAQWSSLHMSSALSFLILAGVHLFVYNWKPFINYLKQKRVQKGETRKINLFKPEVLTSFVLAIIILGGSAWILYPFSLLPETSDTIKQNYREQSDFQGQGAGQGQQSALEYSAPGDTSVIISEEIHGDGIRQGRGDQSGEGLRHRRE